MLTGVFEIDTATYYEMIEFNLKSRGNMVVLGQAGIGKTEIPFQVAKKHGIPYVYWNLSTQEAPDLTGLPIIREKSGVPCVEYAAPTYLPVMELTPVPVMIIIDEIDKAKPDLQNPLLEVLHSHTLNGRQLNINSIVATGNLPEENAFSKPISHALTNRCKIFKLRHNFEAWSEWAVENGLNPIVIGFLSKNQEYLSQPTVVGDPTAYTRCSPRAWSSAARDIDCTNERTNIEFQTLLVAGRVGVEPASKFRVWLEHYRHIAPAIDAIVKNGKIPAMGNMAIDRILVMAIGSCGALASLMRKEVKPSEKAKLAEEVQTVATNVFTFLRELTPDFQIAAVKSTLVAKQMQEFKLTRINTVMDIYKGIREAMGD